MQTWNIAQRTVRNTTPLFGPNTPMATRSLGGTSLPPGFGPQPAAYQLFQALDALNNTFQGFGQFAGQYQAQRSYQPRPQNVRPAVTRRTVARPVFNRTPNTRASSPRPVLARNPETLAASPRPVLNRAEPNRAQGTPATIQYTIQYGDTLWDLATSKGGISIDEFQKLNPNVDLNNYKVGQVVVLPSSASDKLEGWKPAAPRSRSTSGSRTSSPSTGSSTSAPPRQFNPPSTENTFQAPARRFNPPSTENTFQAPARRFNPPSTENTFR